MPFLSPLKVRRFDGMAWSYSALGHRAIWWQKLSLELYLSVWNKVWLTRKKAISLSPFLAGKRAINNHEILDSEVDYQESLW